MHKIENKLIENEFIDFKNHHRNIYNIYFHILCGFVFIPFLFSLSKKYCYVLLILYTMLLLFTVSNVIITITISIVLIIIMQVIGRYNLSFFNKLVLFFIITLSFFNRRTNSFKC